MYNSLQAYDCAVKILHVIIDGWLKIYPAGRSLCKGDDWLVYTQSSRHARSLTVTQPVIEKLWIIKKKRLFIVTSYRPIQQVASSDYKTHLAYYRRICEEFHSFIHSFIYLWNLFSSLFRKPSSLCGVDDNNIELLMMGPTLLV